MEKPEGVPNSVTISTKLESHWDLDFQYRVIFKLNNLRTDIPIYVLEFTV